MKIKRLPINPHKSDFINFTGGLDITSPQITIPTGFCRRAQNFEEDVLGGYATITGYERFNGSEKTPSSSAFYYLNYTGNASSLVAGNPISSTNPSYAYLLYVTPTQLIVTDIVGDWLDDYIINTDIHITDGAFIGSAIDSSTSYYQSLASDYYRQIISEVGGGLSIVTRSGLMTPIVVSSNVITVKLADGSFVNASVVSVLLRSGSSVLLRSGSMTPIVVSSNATTVKLADGSFVNASVVSVLLRSGSSVLLRSGSVLIPIAVCSGPVLGVFYYKGIVYAFRNLLDGGVGLFASSNNGWLPVNLGIEVAYSSGSGAQPAIGGTIAKGTANGILRAITVESGTFSVGTAQGRLIFWSVNNTFTAGAFTAGITATCAGQSDISIPNQNGRYELYIDNFFGGATTSKVYGVDGKNYGFEFDGATFVQIHTGSLYDTPQHVTIHQKYLVYSYSCSLQISAIGDPYNWQAINQAVELGVGDEITSLVRQPGNETSPSLAIYCRNHTYMLYGNSNSTWQLISFNDSAGAIAYSPQNINGRVFVYDDRGITNLNTTLNYGNFTEATISQRVKTLLANKRNSFVDSHALRDKQQYRMFFNDGSGIYLTLSEKVNSFMPVQFTDIMTCSVSSEIYGGGPDIVFMGTYNGYVMQMEKGTSFDGQPITAFIDLVFNNTQSYRMLKRYRRLTFEMVGNGYAEYNTNYDLNYASTDYAQELDSINKVNIGSFNWDSGIRWDSNAIWDGAPVTNTTMAIDGDGMNISLKISSSSNSFA